jgi:hypothetical protein
LKLSWIVAAIKNADALKMEVCEDTNLGVKKARAQRRQGQWGLLNGEFLSFNF